MRRSVVVVLAAWFVAAVSAVATGLLVRLPLPPPAIVAALAAATVFVTLGAPAGRAWARTADLRYLVALHLVRFVGVAFLLLVSRGVLARAFLPIGWGDTVAALGAVALLVTRPALSTRTGWWSVLVWNVFGFADMLLLVITGVRMATGAPEQFALFRQLPFGLLPTFFVPLIIATHIFIFFRLFSSRSASTRE
jgi:hypothetical protein